MSTKMEVHFSSISNEWETPIAVFDKLNQEFDFNLDAAATDQNFKCKNYFTKENDALLQDWFIYKRVFLNPVYGRQIGKFIKKAYEESLKGCIVVCLIPSRTDSKYFHEYCAKGEIRFIKGRLKFINRLLPSYKENGDFKINSAPFPSCVVIFRAVNIPLTKYISFKS